MKSLSPEAKTNENPISSERKQLQSSFVDVSVDSRSSFAAEFCNRDIGAEYRFENLSFEVVDKRNKNQVKNHDTKSDHEGTKHQIKNNNNKKQILKGISGACKAGEMLAILGPSGAGKTTLLNMLTLEATHGTGFGDITLNGTSLSRNNFVRNCYYVPQEGSHYSFLTPRESLTYAARLFSKDDSEKITRRVNTLLEVMGLKSCADVKVGNAFFQGLSGGQKKRLSVAVALLSQPLVLFLDEPTSGLDAAAASGIMEFLRDLASMANIMIICTIHQPSSDVFYAADKVMLLANGQLAYLGSANNVIPYFKTIGHTMPQNSNPAEWILDLVNDEFTSPAQVSRILQDWHSRGIAYMATTTTTTTTSDPDPDPNIPADLDVERSKSARNVSQTDGGENAPNFISQLWTLIKRHGLLIARDPTIYTGRCLIFMFMAIFFSIVYINQRERTQTQVLNKMWLCLWFVGPASSLSVIAVYATNMEFKSVKNEIKNGMVRPMEYIVSNILLQIPLMFAVTWLGYLIPAYAISNFDPNQLPTFLMILCVSFLIFEGAANTMGVYFNNFLVGMLGIMNMWFASFLFSGIMVQENDVPWPLRVFMFILPFKWSLSSLMYTEFHELTFRGAYYYSDVPMATISTAINNTSSSSTGLFSSTSTNTTMLTNITTSTQSFYCPYVAPQQCYGPTGIDALNTLHSNWGTVSSQDNVGRNFGILLAMYVVYKFTFAMAVYMKATVAAHIQPHNKSMSAVQESQRSRAIGLDIPIKIVGDLDNNNDSSFQLVASERERLLRQDDFVREFANPDINAEFIFENVFYQVPDHKNKMEKNNGKQIIKGVSGGVKAGEILTIMGPSGAGKTTLLNLLTLESTSGQSYGSITLNGRPLTRQIFLQNCFYVPQYPALYAFLTPRETLMITAKLFDSSKQKDGNGRNTDKIIEKRVNTLLEVTGLQSCADIKIGNEFFLGLSGGQKKRLSVAVALLSRPLVLFLDEPTTGLDAAAASGLMKLLQQLAASAKILVVATIHQPSDQVFANFDNIMLLARGEVAYQGPASRVAPYFQQIGFPMPDKSTPAEYMLDLINDEFTSPERVASVVSAWSHHSTDVRHADHTASHLPRPIRGTSMSSQIHLLLKRQSMLVVRDPMLYIGRMIAYLCANMFFCAVYYAARDRAQSRVIPRMFNDMWCIGTAASMALIIVFGQNREIHTIKNEVKNGMLSPLSYLIANTILQIPILFLMVIVGYLLPFYAVMLSNPEHLGEMICIITAMLWSFEALAELLAVQYENFLIGMLVFLNFWFSSFLFSGVIAAESQVPWPLKIFLYVSPLRYGLETMVYLDFEGDTYGDAQFVDHAPGYACNNGETGASCFGRSGSQVLRSLHSNFETMDDQNTVLRDVLICLLIGGAIKLLYVGMLWKKVTTVQLPKPSAGKVAQVMKAPKMNVDHRTDTITTATATATATTAATTIHVHAPLMTSHIPADSMEKYIDGAVTAVAIDSASPSPHEQAVTTTPTPTPTPSPTLAASLSTTSASTFTSTQAQTQTPVPATESFRARNASIESDADAVELDIISTSGAKQTNRNRHPSTHVVVFHTIQQQ